MFVFHLAKKRHISSGFIVSHRPSFVIIFCNLAFITTGREDTHLTLAVIPFKVGVSNSLLFCHYKHTRENLLSFHSCSVYNSLAKILDKFLNDDYFKHVYIQKLRNSLIKKTWSTTFEDDNLYFLDCRQGCWKMTFYRDYVLNNFLFLCINSLQLYNYIPHFIANSRSNAIFA